MTPRDAAIEVTTPHFDGETYEPDRDHLRLARQHVAVRREMSDGRWWTLRELAEVVGAPEASVSARLRDLRKPRFGGYTIERTYAGGGVWRYRMTEGA